MNPVLEQFIVEGRELIDGCVELLLQMEQHPDDNAKLNELFRLVHTLKGNSGLFEFRTYTALVHHAEDALDAAREAGVAIERALVDVLLQVCDLLGEMTDEIEREGAVSPALAERAAALGTAFGAAPAAVPRAGAAQDRALEKRWRVRYAPDADCFFKGEDPFYTLTQLPGLESIQALAGDGAALSDDYDVFRAHLVLDATAVARGDELETIFRYVREQVTIEPIEDFSAPALAGDDRAALAAVLAAQRAALAVQNTPGALQGVAATVRAAAAFTGCDIRLSEAESDRQAIEAAIAAIEQAVADTAAGTVDGREAEGAMPGGKSAAGEASVRQNRYLRIEQTRVDRLMELVGEMVVAKNGLPYVARRIEGAEPPAELARDVRQQYAAISRIADEMQDAVMRMRMMPVSSIAQRFPRLVRDISQRLGKEVEFVVNGEDTEADKNIIEALADPLLHIVRNSLDHGLEAPAERIAAGKSPQGRLTINAHQESDKIAIEIVDDGRGIDTERVRRKAIDQRLVSDAQAASMTHDEVLQLIFAPGFSTAASVTDLSGRGVGMDVVKSTVERLRGHVVVASPPGAGTSIRMSLPLSIAVSHVMVIRCAGQSYGIPMDAVVETVRLSLDSMQRIKQHWAALMRGRIVPLMELAALLGLPAAATLGEAPEVAVLLVRTRQGVTGLVVDGFDSSMDVILKPMDRLLADIAGYAGTALLGDGSVLMILNPDELI
jgi:two-component system chemotaxis sensor kinase CheA